MIQLQGIERIFMVGDQKVHALKQLDLDVAAGEYISIMGPSGSGKSTLLNILGVLDQPDAGTYRFDEAVVTELDDDSQATLRREKIGFVFQFFHLVPRLSAAENIELPLTLAGVAASERHRRVAELLESMGIVDRAHHKPEQLSGGQRQRVAIARAVVTEPALLLADEPTGNLDRASGSDVIEVLETLNRRGITLMVVTHDRDIGDRATRRIRMVDGAIELDERSHAGV